MLDWISDHAGSLYFLFGVIASGCCFSHAVAARPRHSFTWPASSA